jgi:hypothetical protein
MNPRMASKEQQTIITFLTWHQQPKTSQFRFRHRATRTPILQYPMPWNNKSLIFASKTQP